MRLFFVDVIALCSCLLLRVKAKLRAVFPSESTNTVELPPALAVFTHW